MGFGSQVGFVGRSVKVRNAAVIGHCAAKCELQVSTHCWHLIAEIDSLEAVIRKQEQDWSAMLMSPAAERTTTATTRCGWCRRTMGVFSLSTTCPARLHLRSFSFC